MPEQLETRFVPAEELRVVRDGVKPRITGYAIVFDRPSEVMNMMGMKFQERIATGAADTALAEGKDIRALVDHESTKVLGRTRANTLRYKIDKRGVKVEIDPPDTTYANDVMESIQRGDVDGMSFAFRVAVKGDEWDEEGDIVVRTVRKISEIREFSVVTFPAYPDTDVALRSLDEYRKAQFKGRPLSYADQRLGELRLLK